MVCTTPTTLPLCIQAGATIGLVFVTGVLVWVTVKLAEHTDTLATWTELEVRERVPSFRVRFEDVEYGRIAEDDHGDLYLDEVAFILKVTNTSQADTRIDDVTLESTHEGEWLDSSRLADSFKTERAKQLVDPEPGNPVPAKESRTVHATFTRLGLVFATGKFRLNVTPVGPEESGVTLHGYHTDGDYTVSSMPLREAGRRFEN